MRRALAEFIIAGDLTTNLDFHRWLMNHPRFVAGDFDTGFIGQEFKPDAQPAAADNLRLAAIFAAAAAAQSTNHRGAPAASPDAPRDARTNPWKMLGRLDVLRR